MNEGSRKVWVRTHSLPNGGLAERNDLAGGALRQLGREIRDSNEDFDFDTLHLSVAFDPTLLVDVAEASISIKGGRHE